MDRDTEQISRPKKLETGLGFFFNIVKPKMAKTYA